jgi:hypothetical protein
LILTNALPYTVRVRWLVLGGLVLCVLTGNGCGGGGSQSFQCANNSDCNLMTGGVCEANSFCAYPSSACPSGYKYSSNSGNLSNQCVAAPDMGTHASLGAQGHGWALGGQKTTSTSFVLYHTMGQGTPVGPKQQSNTLKNDPGILGGKP